MVILGIDPGVATIGFGLIRAERGRNTLMQYGVITTPAGIPLSRRLLQISEDMDQLLNRFKPDEIAVEELFFNKNVKTAVDVAQGRGVILLAARKCGIDLYEYTPLQVKQSLVGYGRAEKTQIMYMTKLMLGLSETPKPDDTADALAIAICHANSMMHSVG